MKADIFSLLFYIFCVFVISNSLGTNQGESCGVKKSSTRSGVLNGDDAEMNEYPWMVHLRIDFPTCFSFFCGGSLIGSQWVLTARHCLGGHLCLEDPDRIEVFLGDHDRSTTGESKMEKKVQVEKWFFNTTNFEISKDIALLKLKERVDLDIYTPICLPDKEDHIEEYIGKDAWVTGWGQTETGETSDILQEAVLEVIPNHQCEPAIRNWLKDSEMCAGDRSSTNIKNSCFGDSGGPLSYADQTGRHKQIGIVSYQFGTECEVPGLYGIYSNVVYFKEWIQDTMNKNGDAKLPFSN